MATSEEILKVKNKAESLKPYARVFKEFHDQGHGFKAILSCLAHAQRPMTSRELMQFLPVSSARMAVLIRSMEEKGLAEKKPDSKDRRSVRIELTQKGAELCRKGEAKMRKSISATIDEVGFERIMDCLDTLGLIFQSADFHQKEALRELKESEKTVFDEFFEKALQTSGSCAESGSCCPPESLGKEKEC